MKRANQISGIVLLLFSLGVLYESSKLDMFWGKIPGSGFLPFWLSLAMAALSLLLVLGSFRRGEGDNRPASWPRGRGLLWICATLLGLVGYLVLIPFLGYIISTFAFTWMLVWLLGSYRWYWSVGVGLANAVGLYLVFQGWLSMGLPTGLLIIP